MEATGALVKLKSKPQNIQYGIPNVEGEDLRKTEFVIRYSLFDIRYSTWNSVAAVALHGRF
jgi:hypothetical protein